MLRALLFDFNGVLVDDEPIHVEMIRRVAVEEKLISEETVLGADFVGIGDSVCFERLLTRAGESVQSARVSRLLARKRSYYREEIRRQGFPFFPGAAELVAAASEAGLMLGIVSNARSEEVRSALEQAGLSRRFKVLITADEVAEPKPSPEPYLKALEALSAEPPLPDRLIHPHEVLAVEDSPSGLASAFAAGISTLAVAHSFPRNMLAGADLVVEKLSEIRLSEVMARFAEV